MNHTPRIAVAGVLLALIAGALILVFATPPAPSVPTAPVRPGAGLDGTGGPGASTEVKVGVDNRDAASGAAAGTRTELPPTAASGADCAQGVRGRVVDAAGRAVADARVYLMPGIGKDILQSMRRLQQGAHFAPIAAAVTAVDGRFAVGLEHWTESAVFDLHVLHPDHCDRREPGLRIQPEDWIETTIKLQPGVRISGRVSSVSGGAIAAATVTVRDSSGVFAVPPPGRELGIQAQTDANGRFALDPVSEVGIYSVTAVAAGFAQSERHELKFGAAPGTAPGTPPGTATEVEVDFTLVPGLAITGSVIDPRGRPVKGARITVAALSQKSRIVETATADVEGGFAVDGLRSGPYAVSVEADGFLAADLRPVTAGADPLTITMEQSGRVLVTALDADGRPLREFHCNLKSAPPGHDQFGNAIVSRPVRGATDGTVLIEGLNPMHYVAEVFAAGYAKNFSARFEITEAMDDTPRVTVRLDRGGELFGRIVDGVGEPIAGVQVMTRPHGMIDNKFIEMFQIPYTITQRHTKSDVDGRFVLPLLYPGRYQLKLLHPGFCTELVNEVAVTRGARMEIRIKMVRGCVVSGIAHIGGQPAGQVTVHVSAIPVAARPSPTSFEATSDNLGKFVLPARLPPGEYEVTAARPHGGNIFGTFIDLRESKRLVRIGTDLAQMRVDVHLKPR